MLQERHRSASHDSISGPPTISAVVKSFKASERLPDVAINHEGMCNRNFLAIAVDVTGLTKPPDIHVAVGDLEPMNRELQRPVDSKLVLPQRVRKTGGERRGFRKAAGRHFVIQVAGSNRQKLRHPNRDVHLRHRYCHFAVVEAVEVQSDPVSYRSDEPEKAAWHEDRASSLARIRSSRCSRYV